MSYIFLTNITLLLNLFLFYLLSYKIINHIIFYLRIAAENMLEKLKDFEPVEIQIPHTGKDKKKRKRKKTKMIKNKIDEISMALDNVGKTVLGFANNIFGEDNQVKI